MEQPLTMTQKNQENTTEQKYFIDEDLDFPQESTDFKNLLDNRIKQSSSSNIEALAAGKTLEGTIVEITKDFVIVDVGLKSEGMIPNSDFSNPEEIGVGKVLDFYIEDTEGDNGQIVLSREKAKRLKQWSYITEHCGEGSIVEGTVIKKVKGGLIVDIGIEAFLPGSQIDTKRILNIEEFVGKTYKFKILKINLERKNIVISRREVLESQRMEKRTELLKHIGVGDLRKGIVKNITDFGVFIDLDGIDGLLHITDMAWKRIRHPSELVNIGDELEVVILSIDEEKGRLALGLKQKEENPWVNIEKKYPIGTPIKGKIVSLVSYGAFIEIEPGIEGLIHVSEMSWVKNVTDPTQIVNKGDEVEAIVLSIQKDDGKISLGMKQTGKNPWEDLDQKYHLGDQVEVEIRNLTNYGAFVELEPGVDGLIHISDLSWIKKISHPSEILKKGDLVKAMILSVDKESKKITLGVKQLTDNPWESIEKTLPPGSIVKGKITKITAFGAFVELNNGIEGLVHVTELSDQPFNKVEDVVQVEDQITAKVLKLDPEHKKISLSMKNENNHSSYQNRDDIVVKTTETKEDKK